MKKALIKLIDVRSIMTLAVTFVLCVLTVLGREIPQEFMAMFNLIIAFYFVKQSIKDKEGGTIEKQSEN